MNAPLENVSVPPSAPRVRDDLISPDPLLDCLIEVARLHGQAATRASLSAGLPLQPQEPLPLALAERAAARAGLTTRVQRLPLADIDALTLPAILILQDNKACVLLGRRNLHGRRLGLGCARGERAGGQRQAEGGWLHSGVLPGAPGGRLQLI